MAIDRFPLNVLDDGGAADGDQLVWDAALGMWVPQAAAASLVDPTTTKGDLIVRGASGLVRLGVGADGQAVVADSTAAAGVKWAAAGGGGSSSNYPPGSADKPPASPNAKDDEFDGTSSVNWTTTPTAPNTWNINTNRDSHAYLKASGSGAAYVGKYQAIPASYPFTITAKVSSTARANYQRGGGIILGPAAPTSTNNMVYLGALYNAGRVVERITAQFGGTFVSQTAAALPGYWGPVYLKLVATSATSISSYASTDGFNWMPVETGLNPGFTPGVIGLALNDETAGSGCEAWFDFFRIS